MTISVEKDKIVLINTENFDIKSILECGQVFRYAARGGGYAVYSKDKCAFVRQTPDMAEIVTADPNYFYGYFDLERDYGEITAALSAKGGITAEAVEYGRGIRILNQDLTEMIFSFILSSNNNIKRIQGILERLCQGLGEKTPYGHAFPSVESLAAAPESFYRAIGCGYRAPYMSKTAMALLGGFDLKGLDALPASAARKRLMSLSGVGGKVADCILLFGLKKSDVFPVDTWIKKVYADYFSDGKDASQEQIADFFVKYYGNLSGYAQQYLFYMQRESIAKAK